MDLWFPLCVLDRAVRVPLFWNGLDVGERRKKEKRNEENGRAEKRSIRICSRCITLLSFALTYCALFFFLSFVALCSRWLFFVRLCSRLFLFAMLCCCSHRLSFVAFCLPCFVSQSFPLFQTHSQHQSVCFLCRDFTSSPMCRVDIGFDGSPNQLALYRDSLEAL